MNNLFSKEGRWITIIIQICIAIAVAVWFIPIVQVIKIIVTVIFVILGLLILLIGLFIPGP